MQAIARVKYLKVAPKKMRLVAELVKGKPVEEALNILNYTPKVAAHHLAKTVKSPDFFHHLPQMIFFYKLVFQEVTVVKSKFAGGVISVF